MRQLNSGSGRHEDSKHLKMDEEPEFEMPDQTGHQQQGEASVLRLPRQGLRQALCSPLQGISALQAFPAPGLALHCEEVQSGSGTVTEASVQFKIQKRKVNDNGKTLMNKAASDIGYVSWLNCLDEDLSFSERVELWRVKSAFRCFINHFEAWEGLKRAMNMDSTGLTILSSTILGKKIKHAKDRVGHSIGQLLQPVWTSAPSTRQFAYCTDGVTTLAPSPLSGVISIFWNGRTPETFLKHSGSWYLLSLRHQRKKGKFSGRRSTPTGCRRCGRWE